MGVVELEVELEVEVEVVVAQLVVEASSLLAVEVLLPLHLCCNCNCNYMVYQEGNLPLTRSLIEILLSAWHSPCQEKLEMHCY